MRIATLGPVGLLFLGLVVFCFIGERREQASNWDQETEASSPEE
jgi:hypothetical protein